MKTDALFKKWFLLFFGAKTLVYKVSETSIQLIIFVILVKL
jgi:hypothetical protein